MLTDAETRLLDDISDDWYALWEVDAGFRRDTPKVAITARRAMVIAVLERGFVDLRVAQEWNEMADAPALQKPAAIEALSRDANWAIPSDNGKDSIYALALTAKGEAERLRDR